MTFDDLIKFRLPLNRKERYYTGTIFPAIVCADNFKHFPRFLTLVNCSDWIVDVSVQTTNIQFFTEYSLFESLVVTDRFKNFYPNVEGTRATPDIFIFIDGQDGQAPLLIAIEAKMYKAISRTELVGQMDRQESEVLSRLKKKWPLLRVAHVALLPEPLAHKFGDLGPGRPVITWEQIYESFEDIKSVEYFLTVLKVALSNYASLKSDGASGKNAEGRLTGENILTSVMNNECQYQIMGRQNGLPRALADVDGETWRKQEYEVNIALEPPNRNWFLISTFVELVKAKSAPTPDEKSPLSAVGI